MSGRRVADRAGTALLVAAPLAAAVLLWLFPRWTVDDACILFRYADNLARAGELTYNVGEPPVEGYTGVLYPVLLAAGIRAGIDPAALGRAIGIGSLFAAGLLLVSGLKALGVSRLGRGVGAVLYFASPVLSIHATSGMETMLFALTVALVFRLLVAASAPGASARVDALTALSLLAAALTRPDGIALAAGAFVAVAGVRTVRGDGSAGRFALLFVALFALPWGAYFAWRWGYYGAFLPNTYYAKLHPDPPSMSSLRAMAAFAIEYLKNPLAAAFVLVAAGWDVVRRRRDRIAEFGRRYAALLAAAALFCLALAIQYARSRLLMNFAFRYFAPLLPLVAGMAALALDAGGRALARSDRRRLVRVSAAALAVFLLVLQMRAYARDAARQIDFATEYRTLMTEVHGPIARYLKETVPAGQWLAVLIDAGLIPYESGLKTIDFGGLNDAYLARTRPDLSAVADYFFAHDPAAAVITCGSPAGPEEGTVRGTIVRDPRFARYRLVHTVGGSTRRYRTLLRIRLYSGGYRRCRETGCAASVDRRSIAGGKRMRTCTKNVGLAAAMIASNTWLLTDDEGRRFLVDCGHALERNGLRIALWRAGGAPAGRPDGAASDPPPTATTRGTPRGFGSVSTRPSSATRPTRRRSPAGLARSRSSAGSATRSTNFSATWRTAGRRGRPSTRRSRSGRSGGGFRPIRRSVTRRGR